MSNVIKGANGMKYRVTGQDGDYAVIELRAQRDKTVFHAATRKECLEWIERNGHDAWN